MLRWCNVRARLHVYAVLRWCNVLARLLRCEVGGPHAYIVNGLGRCECEERRKLQEPNRLSVVGTTSKHVAPVRWRTALAQPSMLDSGIESISGSIATTCLSETWRPHARWKEMLLKLIVVWCRNWSLQKWQNVRRRFGTWMSKTHGCVNPCYLFFRTVLWRTGVFTCRSFEAQVLLRTGALTHRRLYTQVLYKQKRLQTKTSTHKRFYRENFWHTHTHTHKQVLQMLLHKFFFAQMHLHAFFYAQLRLSCFYMQKFWHTHRNLTDRCF